MTQSTHEPEPDSHASAAAAAPAHDAVHGGAHGTEGEGEPLGPIDTAAWAAGTLGTAVALIVTICFVAATAGTKAF
jgi:hypothetical protein